MPRGKAVSAFWSSDADRDFAGAAATIRCSIPITETANLILLGRLRTDKAGSREVGRTEIHYKCFCPTC